MTPRDVIERLTLDQRAEIAAICMESLDVDAVWDILHFVSTEDELLDIGLRIRTRIAA